MFSLKGKVALVTGGTKWLGRDMAEAMAQNGADIIITSRILHKASIAAKEIADKYNVNALGLSLDVNNIESVEKAAKDAKDWQGHIDILVNNAGGGSGASEGNLFERDYEAIQNMINTNLVGVIFMAKAVGKYMIEQKSGKIINIGSIAGIVGRNRDMYHRSNKMEQPVDYAAAKGGVIALTRDLAGLMSPYGVNVNCISPGGFDKGDLPDKFLEIYGDRTMVGRMGKMGEELKGACVFLASEEASYVTGHNLVVDGGFTVWK
jgi:Dehydrogenases with different specificities (related to short-chain alcohol dehydrogenases)